MTTKELSSLREEFQSYKKGKVYGPYKQKSCDICLSHLSEKKACLTPCDHVFHYDCLSQWYDINANCPICRKSCRESRWTIKVLCQSSTFETCNFNQYDLLTEKLEFDWNFRSKWVWLKFGEYFWLKFRSRHKSISKYHIHNVFYRSEVYTARVQMSRKPMV